MYLYRLTKILYKRLFVMSWRKRMILSKIIIVKEFFLRNMTLKRSFYRSESVK